MTKHSDIEAAAQAAPAIETNRPAPTTKAGGTGQGAPAGGDSHAAAEAAIRSAFADGRAFIPFLTCGDPDLETTAQLVRALAGAGADLIELGIPFSDPTAGARDQDADARLASGTTTDAVLDMTARLHEQVSVPLVYMTYANVIFSYGAERFCRRAAQAGVSGIIVPDCPFEERDEFADACAAAGIVQIYMIAPTSHERIHAIASEARGFLYCVSSLGVTGTRAAIGTDVGAMVAAVRQVSDIPCAVGFGISTPAQARQMADQPDGAIVGSAIVKLIAQHGCRTGPVAGFARQMNARCASIGAKPMRARPGAGPESPTRRVRAAAAKEH